MKLEKLEDLLTVDHDKLKSPEKTRLITRIKQLIKDSGKVEVKADNKAETYPYEAISVVDNQLVKVSFDLKSKEARVVDVEVDPRDSRGANHMAGAYAINAVKRYIKQQKEKTNE